MKGTLKLEVLHEICPGEDIESRRVPVDDLFITLPPHGIHAAVKLLMDMFELYHLSAITGQDRGGETELLYHFWEGQGLTLRTLLPRGSQHIASLTDLIPGAAFYEREVSEMLHVTFDGHPDPRPLLLPDDWPGGAPLRQPSPEASATDAPLAPQQEGVGVPSSGEPGARETVGGGIIIPIGPQHPALKEPLSFLLTVEGERIVDSLLRIGYVHRGIERLCQERTYVQNVHLLERVCGICSHVHTTTYCQAVEALLGLEVPPRANYLRTLLCELERIHSHMLWLGALAENIGFTTIFMYAWRDREVVLDIMEELTGQRVSHAVNIIGGVRVDITEAQAESILARLAGLETQIERFLDLIQHERSFRARTLDVGDLSYDQVRGYCVVGPVARASGLDVDVRRDVPYAAYGGLDFQVIVDYEGDVWARTLVRMQEAVQSLHLCRQVLADLPKGPLAARAPRRVPAGEVVSRAEAPRGELLYYIRSDGSDKPARLKIRTPTLTTLITLHDQMRGINIADIPTVLGGVDLCIACADR